MPDFQFISVSRHGGQRWQQRKGYRFAAEEIIVPLTAKEFPKAVMTLPTGFINVNNLFVPVALMGLTPEKNVMVARDGRWVGGYIPAAYRGYPFRLQLQEEGRMAMAIDEASGLLTTDGEEAGEPFFGEDGKPAKAISEVLSFLNQVELDRRLTAGMCALLQECEVLQPWTITSNSSAQERPMQGLFRVDETALSNLSDEMFLKLRKAGAVKLAYCQLLSMQHIELLAKLLDVQQRQAPDVTSLLQSETIDFSNL